MHCASTVCLFAVLVGVGCNTGESAATVVTTAITATNCTSTMASATLPHGGGGMSETGLGGNATDDGNEVGGGGSTGGNGGSGDSPSSTEVDTETNTSTSTSTSTSANTAGNTGGDGDSDTGSSDATGSGGDTGGDTDGTDGVEMCDGALLLGMTPGCVEGLKIESAAWADAYCAEAFGVGWIWLEHHQQGGWFVQGKWIDDNGVGERGWVYVNDQTSACYETDYGVTWVRAAFPDWQCRADCWSTIGLEGPEYNPQDGEKCNSYEGDTPCEYCRPLICARP